MLREPRSQCQRSSATVRRRRVCRKSARDEARFLLVLGFELLKHRRHRTRIVTRGIHVLDTEFVSLFFSPATELHEDTEQADAGGVLINQSRNATEENRSAECGIFEQARLDRKSTRLNSSHGYISYAVFCLKKKKKKK